MTSIFQKYEDLIESLHISDQYTGVIDDTAEDDSGAVVVKVPERKIIFTYTGELQMLYVTDHWNKYCEPLPFAAAPRSAKHGNMKSLEPLLRFVMQMIDRVNKYKLSKEVRHSNNNCDEACKINM